MSSIDLSLNVVDDEDSMSSSLSSGNSFASLGLDSWLCEVIRELGYAHPTAIQKKAIPHILQNRDVLGRSETGSGKTAAFALPVLHALGKEPYGIFALVLAPTRELAAQIRDQFAAFGAPLGLRISLCIGGGSMVTQARELESRPHILIATPGRLADHIRSGHTVPISHIRTLILDEADRLLELGFAEELATILKLLPPKRQTLLFSATMTSNLERLKRVALSHDAVICEVDPKYQIVDKLDQKLLIVPQKVKEVYCAYLIAKLAPEPMIVFTSTCRLCQLMQMVLQDLDTCKSVALHSVLSQRDRMQAVERFRNRQADVLVCTDVASRGLDIPQVRVVINFDVPRNPKHYVHRVGRTARAGKGGMSITLVSQYEIELLKKIEELTGSKMEEYEVDEDDVLRNLNDVSTSMRLASIKLDHSDMKNKFEEKRERNRRDRDREKALRASGLNDEDEDDNEGERFHPDRLHFSPPSSEMSHEACSAPSPLSATTAPIPSLRSSSSSPRSARRVHRVVKRVRSRASKAKATS